MCLSLGEVFLSLEGQVHPKMLMFISVELISIAIGLSKSYKFKSIQISTRNVHSRLQNPHLSPKNHQLKFIG